jgi:hypothetical protein
MYQVMVGRSPLGRPLAAADPLVGPAAISPPNANDATKRILEKRLLRIRLTQLLSTAMIQSMTAQDKELVADVARHDRQIRAIKALVEEGMRMVITDKRAIRQIRADQSELRAVRKAFIESSTAVPASPPKRGRLSKRVLGSDSTRKSPPATLPRI